jgi:hypothetical protein
MMSLDDGKWQELHGGYRTPYDVSVALRSLQDEGDGDVWDELWEELHHQGDVDIASYAAIPQLVHIAASRSGRDWNFYGLVSTIEVARHRKDNPAIPMWLEADYDSAWAKIPSLAMADLGTKIDQVTTCAILGALALAKGELKLGAMLSGLDESELDEWLDEHLAWSELYK